MTAAVPDRADPHLEAARYALLRRLAPSMRHHLVVNLQPIGMVYEVMDRRLRSPHPDLGELHQGAQKINALARAALDSSNDVITWLAPDTSRTVSVDEGVRECLGLLATSLTFRGFALRNEMTAPPGAVSRAAVRTVLCAALLHLTDQGASPSELELSAQAVDGAVVLRLVLRAGVGEQAFASDVPYRRLRWEDLEALATGEGVAVARPGLHQVELSIPVAGGVA
jgi:hypothetical protein